jgi:hypothetical protein
MSTVPDVRVERALKLAVAGSYAVPTSDTVTGSIEPSSAVTFDVKLPVISPADAAEPESV